MPNKLIDVICLKLINKIVKDLSQTFQVTTKKNTPGTLNPYFMGRIL